METDKKQPEILRKRISAAISRLLINQPFFGTLLSSLEINKTSKYHTLATDGSQIYFGEDFVDKLNDDELRAVLLHEALHIAYLHCDPTRQIKTENNLWNVACDLVINEEISQDIHEELPKGGLRCESAHGMSAEEVLSSLEVRKKSPPEKESAPSNPPERSSPSKRNGGQPDIEVTEIWFNGWKGSRSLKEKLTGETLDNLLPMNKEKKEEIVQVIFTAYESALRSGNGRGNIPGSLARMIEGLRKPKVPWQRVLQRFVSTVLAREDYRFFPPNRRYISQDIWIPSLRSEKVGNLAVAIDTSGSIDGPVLDQFISEVGKIVGLCEEVLLIICDCQIYSVEKVRNLRELTSKAKHIQGGGGTSHIPVFKEIGERKSQIEGLICLTDGYSEFPQKAPNYPVLWCLTQEHSTPPWGECVVIKERR